jgi:hypothetical protein
MMNVKLNVCGHTFETTYDTIVKIPYFKNMFDGCEQVTEGSIFVNRSPNIFEHVLALAIDEKYPYPKKYAFELDFYGVDYENEKLYDKITEMENRINDKLTPLIFGTQTHKCKYLFCDTIIGTNKNRCLNHWGTHQICNISQCIQPRIVGYELCGTHNKLQKK